MDFTASLSDAFWRKWPSYTDVITLIDDIVNYTCPSVASHFVLPEKTVSGREVHGVLLANRHSVTPPNGIFLLGGVHPREWLPIPAVLYTAWRLCVDSRSKQGGQFLADVAVHIVPVLNVDVYMHSWELHSLGEMNFEGQIGREFRKNLHGVDLNRNFGFKWGIGGSGAANTKIHASDYPGTGPFSEPETRAVRDYVNSQKKFRLTAFLDIHGYESVIHTPFFHTLDPPVDHSLHRATAMWMAHAVSKAGGARMTYEVVEGAKASFRIGSGLSADWAYGEAGILHAYILEMAPRSRTEADVIALSKLCHSDTGRCPFPWPACVHEVGCSNATILDHARDVHAALLQLGSCIAGVQDCSADLPPNSSSFEALTLHICEAVNRTLNAIGNACGHPHDIWKPPAPWCVQCVPKADSLKSTLKKELEGSPYYVGSNQASGPATDFEEYWERCVWRLSGASRLSSQHEASWLALQHRCSALDDNAMNEANTQDSALPFLSQDSTSTKTSEQKPNTDVQGFSESLNSSKDPLSNRSALPEVSQWADSAELAQAQSQSPTHRYVALGLVVIQVLVNV